MEQRKLFVLNKCFTCQGKKIFCPYCDSNGKAYIEASDKTINEWFKSQTNERKEEIINLFKEDET